MSSTEDGESALVRAGKKAWSLLGIAGVLLVAWIVVSHLAVVVIPLIVVLFIAAALTPVVNLLDRAHLPRPLAAALTVIAAFAVVGGVFALVVPSFVAQLPDLRRSLSNAVEQLQTILPQLPFVGPNVSLSAIVQKAVTQFMGGMSVPAAVGAVVAVLGGIVLSIVILLFYLAEGRWLATALVSWLPRPRREEVWKLAVDLWEIVGRYFRALVVVALFDAVLIGGGLALLGVPLALPLGVLTFFGAFLPYIGATVSGLIAVLVTLAERGLVTALFALALVLAVQQLEGNVLQPLVMGKLVRLPAFVVLVVIAAGATVLGILGAFLAVPVAACVEHVLEHVSRKRDRPQTT